MGRYTATHVSPNGAGDARPTALEIVKDNDLEGKLTGKIIVVTGTSSGIGIETARALSATGATLFLPVRDTKAAEAALEGILEPGRVSLVQLDNNSFRSVKAAAETILKHSNNKVNILVANAGIMGVPERTLTEDGHEVHFQTNHLSHFLLFHLLKPALLASSTPEFNSRVVLVASSAHRAVTLLDSDNYDFEKGNYDAQLAYAHSKLVNIYVANEIERRYGSKGLHGISINPGIIGETKMARSMGPEVVAQIMSDPYLVSILKSHEQGAATTVLAAIGKEWEGKGGKYLEDAEEAKRGQDDNQPLGVGWAKQTYDPECEARIWKDSLRIVGVSDDV
ncbi:short-chain dehydrogenase [Melanomma pulvis-pyrius CBS 109.77]|uniref:Short-chain dehydrogenase n=1 Tax=Melanomma pulvis-pyrius CBS 109.77 TaxID=1314802 RepID=A0A6A6XF12_9PLEO|nr:short-chain dehydrogenase [Melanomma pulvis-pyrius CBS 109.77]